jgi:hypothetical protein
MACHYLLLTQSISMTMTSTKLLPFVDAVTAAQCSHHIDHD